MNIQKIIPSASIGKCLILAVAITMLFLAGCSSKKATVQFKVNSQPEGAYVLYQATGENLPCADKWIYLGNTPLRGVHQFSEKELGDMTKFTMKVMHDGYRDQTRAWDGPSLWEEVEGRGVIFWTPELIPSTR